MTYLLKRLAHSPNKEKVVFKGGTSLSKAYKLIRRFSEDVDLAILRGTENNSQIEKLIKIVAKELTELPFEEIQVDEVTSKKGMIRRTVHSYPKAIQERNFGPVRENILLEINCFEAPVPNEAKPITAFVHDFLAAQGLQDEITKHELEPFTVHVLDKKRTFVEKILSLSYASFMDGDDTKEQRARIRHFYDLTILMREPDIQSFFESTGFTKLIEQARTEESLQSRTQWAEQKLGSAVLHAKPGPALSKIEPFYVADLEPMVFLPEDLPEFREVISVFKKISARLRDEGT